MNVHAKFEVRTFTRSCAAKNWGGPGYASLYPPTKKSYVSTVLYAYCMIL